MARVKRNAEVGTNLSSTSTENDEQTTTQETTSQSGDEQSQSVTAPEPVAIPELQPVALSPSLPNPALNDPSILPPAKRRGRPPGSKNRKSNQPEEAKPATVEIPVEMLGAVATLYSMGLELAGMSPLAEGEKQLITVAVPPVLAKHSDKLKYAPEALLFAALAMPLVPRIIERQKAKKAEQERKAA